MLVQFLIIGLGDEYLVVIEKMYFLLIAHADVGMSAQKVMQRCGAGFLRTGQDEVEAANLFAAPGPKHYSKCKRNFHVQAMVFREALECGASSHRFWT